jgi:hypothetical protein
MSGDESALEVLSSELAQLANGASFTAAEFTAQGVTVWTVSRDDKGTPERPRYTDFAEVPDTDPAALADFYARQLAPLLGRRLVFVARSRADYPAHLLALLLDQRHVPVYECQTPLKDHIRAAITVSPLRVGYELVVLQQEQDGGLTMGLRPLFPQDAFSGYTTEFTVRCAPTDDRGTVFAVMIRERGAGATPASPRPWPIELQSAKVPPGEYPVSARLIRPGHVAFRGLPVDLTPESRTWQEIVRTVPEGLPASRPAHLVCMLEVSDTEHLEHRIERLEELITAAEASGRQLRVSLVTYGPHSVERGVPEEPATVVAWATRSDLAVRKLVALKGHTAPDNEYPRAAQLECALRAVASMFTGRNPGRDGKPVLVTAGTRPPHPDRVDVHTEIIPCRDRVRWQKIFNSLCETLPDLKFGALCNAGAVGNIWSSLGRDAIEEIEVVDMPAFAAKLGLRDSAQAVPFPLI